MYSLSFFQRRSRACSTSEDRLARLRRVLDKLDPDSLTGKRQGLDLEAALQDFEPSWPPERLAFADPQPLLFPLASPRRIAVLRGGFTLPSNAREFAAADLAGIRAWEPDALVVPLNATLLLADQELRGQLKLPSLQTALAVVTRIDDAPLAHHHRELLWRAFEVPVFELLLSWDGAIIARECEVHEGLHIDGDAVIPSVRDGELLLTHLNDSRTPVVLARTGFAAEIIAEQCHCGSASVRLLNLTPVRQRVHAG